MTNRDGCRNGGYTRTQALSREMETLQALKREAMRGESSDGSSYGGLHSAPLNAVVEESCFSSESNGSQLVASPVSDVVDSDEESQSAPETVTWYSNGFSPTSATSNTDKPSNKVSLSFAAHTLHVNSGYVEENFGNLSTYRPRVLYSDSGKSGGQTPSSQEYLEMPTTPSSEDKRSVTSTTDGNVRFETRWKVSAAGVDEGFKISSMVSDVDAGSTSTTDMDDAALMHTSSLKNGRMGFASDVSTLSSVSSLSKPSNWGSGGAISRYAPISCDGFSFASN